jgi:signal peptidase I
VKRARSVALVALVVVAALAAVRFVAEPFRVPSGSMVPTLRSGDSVLVEKLSHGARRGDLVVFRRPGNGEILLKRVVAVGGDTVALEDGALYVDGHRRHEAYANPHAIDGVYFGPVRVPRGSLFAMGDNRGDSLDSRQFGAVPAARVIGRVVARIWPPTRWGMPG